MEEYQWIVDLTAQTVLSVTFTLTGMGALLLLIGAI